MGDLSTREQIRAEAIERLARWEHQLTRAKYPDCVVPPWDEDSEERREAHRAAVSGYVDALGDLLPTGIEWGAALAPDEQPITTVVFGFTGNEEAARTWEHPVRRYTADWIEVTE